MSVEYLRNCGKKSLRENRVFTFTAVLECVLALTVYIPEFN